MGRPLIGVTTSLVVDSDRPFKYALHKAYVDRIREAGGMPFFLPFAASLEEAREILERLDGLMLTGGNDMNPGRWGEEPHPRATLMHPDRDRSEPLYCRAALERDMATLGICLGSQVINVTLGGTLHQHMPDLPNISEAHRKPESEHDIEVEEGLLQSILGYRRGRVNSFHHQACAAIGEGLRVVARAEDGIPEGLVSVKHSFVVAVQWHPERMEGEPAQRRLFEQFVRRC
jgi:putative glutamine amidotransferase